MKFTDKEYKQYLQTENITPFREWATKWLQKKESREEVTSQDIQALRKKIYVRLDVLLETDVANYRVFLPVDHFDRWENQEKNRLEEINTVDKQISSYENDIKKLNTNVLDPEDVRDAKIAKKKTKLEDAEEKKKGLEQQKCEYKIRCVRLYDYLTKNEIMFFEFLLSNFSDRNSLTALRKMELEYGMRKKIDELLSNIIMDQENGFSSTCLLLGDSLFGKWSGEYPSKLAYDSIHEKLVYTERYHLYPFLHNFNTLLDLLDELEEHYLDEEKSKPSKIFDEEFFCIMKNVDEVLECAIDKLKKKYEFFDPAFLDDEIISLMKKKKSILNSSRKQE